MQMRFILLILILTGCRTSLSVDDKNFQKASRTLPAHAHNDYSNEKPLLEALALGFKSIEVDIHLIDDELYVSHDTPYSVNKEKTLSVMYLEPLSNAEFVQEPLILLIDVKTDAKETYLKLVDVLGQFKIKNVEYVISGNRAIDEILNDSIRLMSIDGRPEDLTKNIPASYMPMISQHFNKFFSDREPSKIDLKEKEAFNIFVTQAHEQGRLVRLWGTPDHPEMWDFLKEQGVDLINTDKVLAFSKYYNAGLGN